MQSLSIIVAENDAAVARSLVTSLDQYFRSVQVVCSLDELKSLVLRLPADAAIVDLETIGLRQVVDFRREFNLPVVCTHRVPDDEIWTAPMDAGAADVCERSHVAAILRAVNYARARAA